MTYQNLPSISECDTFLKGKNLPHGKAVREQVNNARLDARKKGIIVVVTTRAGAGRIIRTSVYENEGIVAGDNLSPQKARILLKLALTVTTDPEEIQKIFNAY